MDGYRIEAGGSNGGPVRSETGEAKRDPRFESFFIQELSTVYSVPGTVLVAGHIVTSKTSPALTLTHD